MTKIITNIPVIDKIKTNPISYQEAKRTKNKLTISNNSVIYFWYNTITEKGYLGSARLYKERVFVHMSPTETSRYFQNSIKKHGKSAFILFILHDFGCMIEDRNIRFTKEQFFLDTIPHSLLYNSNFNAWGGRNQ